MKRQLLYILSIFAAAIVLLSSCKKSKPNQTPEPGPSAYDIMLQEENNTSQNIGKMEFPLPLARAEAPLMQQPWQLRAMTSILLVTK